MQKQSHRVALLVILSIAAFFRFWDITHVPPGLYPDEAMNGTNAQESIIAGSYPLFYPENNGRESFFIIIQSLSLRIFGNEPWALRIVSACFGTLTVLGLYFLARELFYKEQERRERLALTASFLLAISLWHINFSRIGFRAILVPFLLTWSIYFVLRMLRNLEQPNAGIWPELWAILGGISYGLGFHTYIAYRVTPPILLVLFFIGWRRYKTGLLQKCFPCMFVLFLFAAFLAALPIGYYFLSHPEDFSGRTAQVSAFSSDKPAVTIGLNIVKTLGMFVWAGDYNWRHNFAGDSELWWPVAIIFIWGLLYAIWQTICSPSRIVARLFTSPEGLLLVWFGALAIPAVISNEGIPHALRTIGMIPPAMIFAAIGFDLLVRTLRRRGDAMALAQPGSEDHYMRVRKEFTVLLIMICIGLGVHTYLRYFLTWAVKPEVTSSFAENYTYIGTYLRALPTETKKYVIVNAGGVDVRGIPMPAQPVMFLMGEGPATRGVETPRTHTTYILPEDISTISPSSLPKGTTVFAMLELDGHTRYQLKTQFPSIEFKEIPGKLLVGVITTN